MELSIPRGSVVMLVVLLLPRFLDSLNIILFGALT